MYSLTRRPKNSDAARAPHRRDARRYAAALAPAQCRLGDARGLEVSPSSLLQNELIQRQIGNRLAQSAVLELKVLQALHLLGLQPAKLLCATDQCRPSAPVRTATRRHHSAEEKIRIVLEGLRGENSIAELCRKEGINQNLYYRW